MLDDLFNLFKSDKLTKLNTILGTVENLVLVFEQEFEQDHKAKNAALDALIEVLDNLKT